MPEGDKVETKVDESKKDESKTDVLESPEVKAAIEAARKEANSDGYKKGQSDQNKATQTAMDAKKTAEEKVAELEKQRFEGLSPEDQTKDIVKKLWEDRNAPKPEQQDAPASDPKTDKKEEEPNKLIEAAKEAGLDPDKLVMNKGTAAFLKSVREAGGKESGSGSGEDTEGEGDKPKSKSGGPVDGGGGSPAGTDITKVIPTDIFAKSYKGGS